MSFMMEMVLMMEMVIQMDSEFLNLEFIYFILFF